MKNVLRLIVIAAIASASGAFFGTIGLFVLGFHVPPVAIWEHPFKSLLGLPLALAMVMAAGSFFGIVGVIWAAPIGFVPTLIVGSLLKAAHQRHRLSLTIWCSVGALAGVLVSALSPYLGIDFREKAFMSAWIVGGAASMAVFRSTTRIVDPSFRAASNSKT